MKRIARLALAVSLAVTVSAAPRPKDRSDTPTIKRLILKLVKHLPGVKAQDDLPVVPRP